jgi:Flp pilus assembly protein TadG
VSRARSRRGANAIEFGLLFPVLMVLLGGMIDLSWMYTVRLGASSAALVGARAAAVAKPADATSVASSSALTRWSSLGLPEKLTVQSSRSGTPEVQTVQVQVQATGLVVPTRTVTVTASEAVMPRAP